MEKPKILLVEDDPLMAELYQNIFELEGYPVEIAVDGEDGLKKANVQGSQPGLILLDIMMPKLDGFQVLANLKNTEATKDIPVVMLTNLADWERAEETLRHGAIRYIVKSDHDPDEVVKIVRDVLSQNPPPQPQ